MTADGIVLLCPGQGAQAVGMGRAWTEAAPEAAAVFAQADGILGDTLGAPLSKICFDGPDDRLVRTDVSQPAIYTCSVACAAAMRADGGALAGRALAGAAGLSLGEYTALHLAGVLDFEAGLRLVALRGALMQDAAERAEGAMVALIGADESQADAVCAEAGAGDVLVPANFNAPGQIVLSGDRAACARAVEAAEGMELRAKLLDVAGAFHSPLMQPAADGLAEALASAPFQAPNATVWSNVTAEPHDPEDMELLKARLVQQLVRPVRWAQSCQQMPTADTIEYHELAPGAVLRGLMRRIERRIKVTSHDEP
jgi:[acyl-carrier-protein] S-malonyltransferase